MASKMNAFRLTERQRQLLEQFRAVRDLQVRRLTDDFPDCQPARWVVVDTLVRVYHVNRKEIDALVKKGYLLTHHTDGFGVAVEENKLIRSIDT